jgi:hypothetical protein
LSRFEFLSVLLSVVLGLAIAQVLGSWGELIRSRGRVRFFWPHLGWTAFLLVTIIFSWWATWYAREQALHFSFFSYLAALLQPAALVVAVFILTPPVPSAGALDLRAHFFDNARWVFSLLAFSALIVTVGGVIIGSDLFVTAIRATLLLVYGSLALLRDERLHRVGLPMAFALFLLLILRVRST